MLLHARETFSQQPQKAQLWENSKQEHYRHYLGITPCLKSSKAPAWDVGMGLQLITALPGQAVGSVNALDAVLPLWHTIHPIPMISTVSLVQTPWQTHGLLRAGRSCILGAPSLDGEHPSGEPQGTSHPRARERDNTQRPAQVGASPNEGLKSTHSGSRRILCHETVC